MDTLKARAARLFAVVLRTLFDSIDKVRANVRKFFSNQLCSFFIAKNLDNLVSVVVPSNYPILQNRIFSGFESHPGEAKVVNLDRYFEYDSQSAPIVYDKKW